MVCRITLDTILQAGDVLITKRSFEWSDLPDFIKHSVCADELFVVINADYTERGPNIVLLGCDEIIQWTPAWDLISRYFEFASNTHH